MSAIIVYQSLLSRGNLALPVRSQKDDSRDVRVLNRESDIITPRVRKTDLDIFLDHGTFTGFPPYLINDTDLQLQQFNIPVDDSNAMDSAVDIHFIPGSTKGSITLPHNAATRKVSPCATIIVYTYEKLSFDEVLKTSLTIRCTLTPDLFC